MGEQFQQLLEHYTCVSKMQTTQMRGYVSGDMTHICNRCSVSTLCPDEIIGELTSITQILEKASKFGWTSFLVNKNDAWKPDEKGWGTIEMNYVMQF